MRTRVAFGKPLAEQGTIGAQIAESRVESDLGAAAPLRAAALMDTVGNKAARSEIAQIKVWHRGWRYAYSLARFGLTAAPV